MTAIIGGLWVAWTYVNNQREAQRTLQVQAERDAVARTVEARKPFLTRQLELYFQTAEIAAKLATLPAERCNEAVARSHECVVWGMEGKVQRLEKNAEWKTNFQRFNELKWSVLSLVQDNKVRVSMKIFSAEIDALVKIQDVVDKGVPECIDTKPMGEVDDCVRSMTKLRTDQESKLKETASDLATMLKSSLEASWAVGPGITFKTKRE
jgi:hypothetical protein